MISKNLKEAYQQIHANTPFGKRSKLPKFFEKFLNTLDVNSVLDFGCGKGNLVKTLKEIYPNKTIIGIDPANPEFDNPLSKVDLILSTDVLEHIEPDFIDDTLKEIADNCKHTYHLISCAPAKLVLPDGRNAHLIQQSPEWWRKKFLDLGFKIHKEEYNEFEKYSKQLQKTLPVKNYFIMGSKNV